MKATSRILVLDNDPLVGWEVHLWTRTLIYQHMHDAAVCATADCMWSVNAVIDKEAVPGVFALVWPLSLHVNRGGTRGDVFSAWWQTLRCKPWTGRTWTAWAFLMSTITSYRASRTALIKILGFGTIAEVWCCCRMHGRLPLTQLLLLMYVVLFACCALLSI